jgi:superfamily II DNA/RNA helicase
MYSATFLGSVGQLARSLLRDPQRIEVARTPTPTPTSSSGLHWADDGAHKNALLDHILTQREMEQALVFTSTQRDADWLADRLADMGHHVASLHGGHPQGRRNRVLQGLRDGRLKILVATDVAARGIDVRTISHVVNYGLPMKPEDYVHRIGRTGRAGANGLAITLAERRDSGMIRRIQQFTTQTMPVATIAGIEPKAPAPKLHGHAAAPRAGHAPRRGEARRPFDHRADARRPFEPRADARAPFEHRGGDAAARGNPFDRALPVRDDRRAPARPGPASFKSRGKPAPRSRPGGFAR